MRRCTCAEDKPYSLHVRSAEGHLMAPSSERADTHHLTALEELLLKRVSEQLSRRQLRQVLLSGRFQTLDSRGRGAKGETGRHDHRPFRRWLHWVDTVSLVFQGRETGSGVPHHTWHAPPRHRHTTLRPKGRIRRELLHSSSGATNTACSGVWRNHITGQQEKWDHLSDQKSSCRRLASSAGMRKGYIDILHNKQPV